MFTGIVSDIGEVVAREDGRFSIRTRYRRRDARGRRLDGVRRLLPDDDVGARRRQGQRVHRRHLQRDARQDDDRRLEPGRRINLERPLQAGAELGGHVVMGHVDGLARILDVAPDGESRRFSFEVPDHLAPYIAPKGSIALDGVSLTVNEVSDNRFGVNIIPHTLTVTTWGAKTPGQSVNLEVDLFARYVARLLEFRP